MTIRRSLLAVTMLSSLFLGGFACQSQSGTSGNHDPNQKDLLVFVTNNAQKVREKATIYDLEVKTIDGKSPSSQLIQALLNSPSDQYFAVINPVINRYIAGGAVSDKVNPAEIDDLFRKLKQISKAGSQQIDRLYPSEKGKAKLVIFSDFQCPYCKLADSQANEWKKQFGDKLEVDMVHFPLPSHEHALAAAEAAECARLQDKFDPYREALFEQQESLSPYVFNRTASKLNLNMKQFNQCTSLHQTRKKVRQEQYFGQYLGLQGTPTLVLNGEVLFGLNPEDIAEKIQQALEGKEKAPKVSLQQPIGASAS